MVPLGMNVLEQVAEGRARVEWTTVESRYLGKRLTMYVMRDCMKFDDVPALTWDFKPLPRSSPWFTEERFDGVRLPADALTLQRIADITGCLLLTPHIIDLIWLQATTRFNCVVNTPTAPTGDGRTIVATSPLHVVQQEIEKRLADSGGYEGAGPIASTGKYCVLINGLGSDWDKKRYGTDTACNYGWCSSRARSPGVTPGVTCYQPPGFRHNNLHRDPSQGIRLMFRKGVLHHQDGTRELVNLRDVATGKYAGLVHHETSPLTYLRQHGVAEPTSDVVLPYYLPKLSL